MNKKKLQSINIYKLIFLFFTTIICAQTQKKYEGEFSLDSYNNRFQSYGKAKYTYYENEKSERIKNGIFFFQGSEIKIEGSFKDGLRSNLWKFTLNQKPTYLCNIPVTIIINVNYIKGKLNGKCTYVKTSTKTKLILELSTAFFNNNLLINDYVFSKFPETKFDRPINIRYSLNSDGKLNGKYRAEFYNSDFGTIDDVRNYENGVMVNRLCREIVNGKVYFKYENGSYIKEENERDHSVLGSIWDAHIATDFWIGGECMYCGTAFNPIYATKDGLDESGFEYFDNKSKI